MKQQAIELISFTVDSEGNKSPPAASGNLSLDDLSSNYLTDAQRNLEFLTSADVKNNFYAYPADTLKRTKGVTRSYTMNAGLWRGWDFGVGNEQAESVSPSQIPFGSRTILTAERFQSGNIRGARSHGIMGAAHRSLGTSAHTRLDFFNFSFVDGHAEFIHKEIAKNNQNRDEQGPTP